MKEQLEEQKKQCPFCKILSGEIASEKVFENESCIVILDIRPATKGHLLVVPKEHVPILPYLDQKTTDSMFSILPGTMKALKDSLIVFGSTVFVANGGVAGQQSPHFLYHVLPREKGDGLENLDIDEGTEGKKGLVDAAKRSEVVKALSTALPALMRKVFSQLPAPWHKGSGTTPEFLATVREKETVVYEDEKLLATAPTTPLSLGHVTLHSKESRNIDELSAESTTHLFRTASIISTAVFEIAQAQGTNIILHSGNTGDGKETLRVDVISRTQDDGLNLLWKPVSEGADADVASRIKDKMFFVGKEPSERPKQELQKSAPPTTSHLPPATPHHQQPPIKESAPSVQPTRSTSVEHSTQSSFEEINSAIQRVKTG